MDKNTKCGYSFSELDQKDFIFKNNKINLSGFAETFTFPTTAPVVSVLADMAYYTTSSLI